jgi:hypothetical protein
MHGLEKHWVAACWAIWVEVQLLRAVRTRPARCNNSVLLQVRAALKAAGLAVGAINIRFPERFLRGAFTNPDPALVSAAVQLAAEGCKMAAEFGTDHVVVWSPYDGYDHYLQVSAPTAAFCCCGVADCRHAVRLRLPGITWA